MTMVIEEVERILNIFNLKEIGEMLQEQLEAAQSEVINGKERNYFKPLYLTYKSIIDEDNAAEIKRAAEERFTSVCEIFISLISKKFHLQVDEDWKTDNYSQIPGLTMALYSFFVLELQTNLTDVCLQFINEHTDMVYNEFGERKMKKDAMTVVNKKEMTPEAAVIISNIYDVTTWILGQLSEKEFFDLLPSDYVPLRIIADLFSRDELSGEFMSEINDMYAVNIALKSHVCFALFTSLRANKSLFK